MPLVYTNNVLIEFRVSNFYSIKDEVVLDFKASHSKELTENIIPYKHAGLLKSIGIYGANATGKTNIIKAIYFVWSLTKFSHSYNAETKIIPTQFKLDNKNINKPSSFEVIFTKNNVRYQYGFSCLDSKVLEEHLFRWDDASNKPRRATVFRRENVKEFKFNVDKKKQQLIASQMSGNVLYLSRASAFNFEKVRDVYDFLVNDLIINFNPSWNEYTKINAASNPELKNRIVDILQKADFGGISDIVIEKQKAKMAGIQANLTSDGLKVNPIPETDKDIYVAKFLHEINPEETVEFNEWEESSGTIRMFSLLGPMFDILDNGKVMVIDEMETSLHPSISEFIVRLFHSKLNKKNAQLIFTTHNTNLLNSEVLRRDQIYITSKEPNKGTRLDSLVKFKLRDGMDFQRVYLTGRVGGLPFIDETVLD
jgi:AAA15 family ATPase/GTPase